METRGTKEWEAEQRRLAREKRLRDVSDRAREASTLANKVADLSRTLAKLSEGQGFWKTQGAVGLSAWTDMDGLGTSDQSNIRQLVIGYVEKKLAEAEAEFDSV